jgi:hypothetical protein
LIVLVGDGTWKQSGCRSGACEGGLHLVCIFIVSGHGAEAEDIRIIPVIIAGIADPERFLSTLIWQTIISVGGRDSRVAIVSWAIAYSVEMEIVVGRKASTITAMTASGLTTLQVNTTSIWQRIVSVRGRDRLDTRVLGAILPAAVVLVEMGGLGA